LENLREQFNEVYDKAFKALKQVKNGNGYQGILLDINMSGAPTPINLEEAFDKIDLKEISNLHSKYC